MGALWGEGMFCFFGGDSAGGFYVLPMWTKSRMAPRLFGVEFKEKLCLRFFRISKRDASRVLPAVP